MNDNKTYNQEYPEQGNPQNMGDSQPGYPAEPGFAPAPQSDYARVPPYGQDGGLMGSGFSTKEVRAAFVRKVYFILMLQLATTTAIIFMFLHVPAINAFVIRSPGLLLGAYVSFIVLYIVLGCCEHVRRQHPTNLILLALFTLAMSYVVGCISTRYDTDSVLLAFGICAGCCLAVTLFSFNTKYDFTSCVGVLFVLSIAFMIFGFICMFAARTPMTHKIYAGIGAILFMAFLAFDTQMIMGGKKLEISPEDHVFATIQLYMDIVHIFLSILSLFGNKK